MASLPLCDHSPQTNFVAPSRLELNQREQRLVADMRDSRAATFTLAIAGVLAIVMLEAWDLPATFILGLQEIVGVVVFATCTWLMYERGEKKLRLYSFEPADHTMTGEIRALAKPSAGRRGLSASNRRRTASVHDRRTRRDSHTREGVLASRINLGVFAAGYVLSNADLKSWESIPASGPRFAFSVGPCQPEDAMPENISHPLVVSPHFDDAVFSCGAFIAAHPGSVVHTVFSGCPAEDVTTDWDQHCGFTNAAEAMRERACEDDFALEILGAVAERGDFLDAQYAPYGTAPTVESIASKLGVAVASSCCSHPSCSPGPVSFGSRTRAPRMHRCVECKPCAHVLRLRRRPLPPHVGPVAGASRGSCRTRDQCDA